MHETNPLNFLYIQPAETPRHFEASRLHSEYPSLGGPSKVVDGTVAPAAVPEQPTPAGAAPSLHAQEATPHPANAGGLRTEEARRSELELQQRIEKGALNYGVQRMLEVYGQAAADILRPRIEQYGKETIYAYENGLREFKRLVAAVNREQHRKELSQKVGGLLLAPFRLRGK